jgi:hypothetical protein
MEALTSPIASVRETKSPCRKTPTGTEREERLDTASTTPIYSHIGILFEALRGLGTRAI